MYIHVYAYIHIYKYVCPIYTHTYNSAPISPPLVRDTYGKKAVTFDCLEKKRRELDRWKGLDQLFNLSHTPFFAFINENHIFHG